MPLRGIVGGLIIGLERRDHATMGLLDPPKLRFRNARRGEFSVTASSIPMTPKV
jgi:hypothetical protein